MRCRQESIGQLEKDSNDTGGMGLMMKGIKSWSRLLKRRLRRLRIWFQLWALISKVVIIKLWITFIKKSRGSHQVVIRSYQCPMLKNRGHIRQQGLLMALFKGRIMTIEVDQHSKALWKSSQWKSHQKKVLITLQPSEAAEAGVGFPEVSLRDSQLMQLRKNHPR